MQIKTLKPGLEEINLSELKIEEKTAHTEIQKKQKEIKKMVAELDKNTLPKKTQQRYEKTFGKTKEKNAFKIAVLIITVTLIFSYFLQPGPFFSTKGEEIKLTNPTNRTIKNIQVYDSSELFDIFSRNAKTPIITKSTLSPGEEIIIPAKKTTVFIAFAERQLPAIGSIYKYYSGKASQNINNTQVNTNNGLYTDLKEQTSGGN